MKVYVDELPENCDKCPFNCKTLLFSNFDVKNSVWTNECKLGFNFGCRLKSVLEHDKTEKEDLLDKIKFKLREKVRMFENEEHQYFVNCIPWQEIVWVLESFKERQ